MEGKLAIALGSKGQTLSWIEVWQVWSKQQIFYCRQPNCWLRHILTGLVVCSMYVPFFLGVKQVKVPKKPLWFLRVCICSENSGESQGSIIYTYLYKKWMLDHFNPVYFIESKTLGIAWDLCDFHNLLVFCVNLIYRNLVNCQLQEQVHNLYYSPLCSPPLFYFF